MKPRILLFDFDGTVADTATVATEIYNSFAKQYGFNKITKNNLADLRNQNARQVLKDLKIPLWRLPLLLRKGKKELNDRIKTVNAIEGVAQALKQLKNKGFNLYIITSNSVSNVKAFLVKNEIDVIDQIYSESNIFGKYRLIKKLMEKNDWGAKEVAYIGDEIRDIEAARRCNIKIVAVSWGYNSQEALEQAKPDDLITNPKDLNTLFS